MDVRDFVIHLACCKCCAVCRVNAESSATFTDKFSVGLMSGLA